MSKIRVISNPMQHGRNGANTYYVTKGTQIVRPSRNNSNYGEGASRTPAQQARRILWSNPVGFYKISSYWMQKAYETKEPDQSDYNKFMSLNIGRSVCAFTKNEASQGACIAEAFKISQGSLPSVAHTKFGEFVMSSLLIGPEITSESAVYDACISILEANPGLDESYQISLIVYQQNLDFEEIPHLSCFAYELSLNDKRTETTIGDIFPDSIFAVSSGTMCIRLSGYTGGASFVLSRTDSAGRIRVSSQNLIVNNDYLIGLYSSDIQYTKSAESYGVDPSVFLQRGEYQGGGSVPQSIQTWGALWMGSAVYHIGDIASSYLDYNSYQYWELFKLAPIPAGNYSADVYLMKSYPSLATEKVTIQGRIDATSGGSAFRCSEKITPSDTDFQWIVRIDVNVGGTIYRAVFQQPQQ